jgi:hypothetical protein
MTNSERDMAVYMSHIVLTPASELADYQVEMVNEWFVEGCEEMRVPVEVVVVYLRHWFWHECVPMKRHFTLHPSPLYYSVKYQPKSPSRDAG